MRQVVVMDIEQSVMIMKALADTSRLRIARLLVSGPRCVEEVCNRMNLAQSTVSFHLKKLEQAGLLSCEKDQYYSVYRLSDAFFSLDLMDLVAASDSDDGQQDAREKKYRRRVLATFMPRGRLVKFPVQKKKLMIVLEEISGLFEPGREYSEKEVNAIIMRVHDDFCTIRRRMIDEGLMNRDGQHVYRLRAGADGQPEMTAPKAVTEKSVVPAPTKKSGVRKMDRKKELKKEYLDAGTTAGIVRLRCKVNGRVFLTARTNINGAFNRTRIQLETGRHFVSALQKDWNEFGKDNFVYEVLDTLKDADPAELEELKELWRNKLSTPPTNATFY